MSDAIVLCPDCGATTYASEVPCRECPSVSIGDRRRTPLVTIELQLWPQPPEGTEPYWFGNSDLAFRHRYDPTHVWEQNFADLTGLSSESARVECKPPFGWVLVLTLTHDKARRLLTAGGIPSDIERTTRVQADA